MTDLTRPKVVSVHVLALPATTASVLYGLYDVLSLAGVAWSQLTGRPHSEVTFDVGIVSETGAPFTCFGGVPVTPRSGFDTAGQADVVIVTDLMMSFEADPRGTWPAATAWLTRQHADGALLASVCTGSVLLADTGLLDGCEATSHWAFADLFARYFPRVALRPERALVPAPSARRVITSGGVASWEDLTLHLIARFCGHEEAIHTAKVFVIGDRSQGQAAYIAMPRPPRHDDSAIADAQAWIADNYAEPAAVGRMVARSDLPERSFKRRFRAATGYAPIAYVQGLRIEEAKRLLETTPLPTETIGATVGYADPASFRRLFKRETGLTPGRYRRRFQSVGRPDVPGGAAD